MFYVYHLGILENVCTPPEYMLKLLRPDKADYKFKNDNQQKITKITTDSTHGIQYGGMMTAFIMKASSLLYDPYGDLRKNLFGNRLEAQVRAQERADQASAYAEQTNDRNQQADLKAENQKIATETYGQGGGTEATYADVPNLSGYVNPANPSL